MVSVCFGTTIAFGNIDLYFMSAERIMFSLMVYGIMSVIWGIVVSYSVSKNILKSKVNKMEELKWIRKLLSFS